MSAAGLIGACAPPRSEPNGPGLASRHLKGLAVLLFGVGTYFQISALQLAGLVILGHSSLDRALGYGLKYSDSFQHSHLGMIGRAPSA